MSMQLFSNEKNNTVKKGMKQKLISNVNLKTAVINSKFLMNIEKIG